MQPSLPMAQTEAPVARPPIADPDRDNAGAGGQVSVEREIEEWDAARRQRRRALREPWRTVSIVAGLAFVATSWLVPASVARVAELALGVLSVGSFCAGWRARKTTP